ncbi:MAG: TRAP dicarboxylate transporter, DctM subunit, unknown substrate 5, partial [uncultured Acetobacteraceae bacterium]
GADLPRSPVVGAALRAARRRAMDRAVTRRHRAGGHGFRASQPRPVPRLGVLGGDGELDARGAAHVRLDGRDPVPHQAVGGVVQRPRALGAAHPRAVAPRQHPGLRHLRLCVRLLRRHLRHRVQDRAAGAAPARLRRAHRHRQPRHRGHARHHDPALHHHGGLRGGGRGLDRAGLPRRDGPGAHRDGAVQPVHRRLGLAEPRSAAAGRAGHELRRQAAAERAAHPLRDPHHRRHRQHVRGLGDGDGGRGFRRGGEPAPRSRHPGADLAQLPRQLGRRDPAVLHDHVHPRRRRLPQQGDGPHRHTGGPGAGRVGTRPRAVRHHRHPHRRVHRAGHGAGRRFHDRAHHFHRGADRRPGRLRPGVVRHLRRAPGGDRRGHAAAWLQPLRHADHDRQGARRGRVGLSALLRHAGRDGGADHRVPGDPGHRPARHPAVAL